MKRACKAKRMCVWDLCGLNPPSLICTVEAELDGLKARSIAEQIAFGQNVEFNWTEPIVLPEGQRPKEKKR